MRLFAAVAVSVLLSGCDRIDAWLHPYDDAAAIRTTPVPPVAGIEPQLFAHDGGVSLQLRQGDCLKTRCHVFMGGKWKLLPPDDAIGLPLLAVESATGSAYSDDLWSSVGASGDRILINSQAGADNISHGGFDGLRIGLQDFDGQHHYTTGYATAVAFSGQGGTMRLMPNRVAVYIGGDRAWLVHRRNDGEVDLIDLFALNIQTDPRHCLPDLYLDMASKLAGPPEKALSPNIFESRIVDSAAASDLKANVLKCAATKFP